MVLFYVCMFENCKIGSSPPGLNWLLRPVARWIFKFDNSDLAQAREGICLNHGPYMVSLSPAEARTRNSWKLLLCRLTWFCSSGTSSTGLWRTKQQIYITILIGGFRAEWPKWFQIHPTYRGPSGNFYIFTGGQVEILIQKIYRSTFLPGVKWKFWHFYRGSSGNFDNKPLFTRAHE